MKSIPRFFVPSSAIKSQLGLVVYEDSNLCKQLTRVLRLRPGDTIDFLDGLGTLYSCSLQNCIKDEVTAAIDRQVKLDAIKSPQITVALPILKGDRFDWALEKLTEIGVAKIMPIVLQRSVVKPGLSPSQSHLGESSKEANSTNRLTRWHSILKEASEQCERPTIPQLVPPSSFQSLLSEAATDQLPLKIICAERRAAPHLSQLLSERLQSHNRQLGTRSLYNRDASADKFKVIIVIGAEGGFTEKEMVLAIDSGFTPVSLGPLILRSETAAIYASAITTACLDLKI